MTTEQPGTEPLNTEPLNTEPLKADGGLAQAGAHLPSAGLVGSPHASVPPQRAAPDGGLRVESVAVSFGGTEAVRGVDLSVPTGRVLALLGPSGCGKSTLLRAIAGLIEPAGRHVRVSGRVLWDGQDMTRVPVHRRGFGLMFQAGELFGHLSVAANIEYGLRVARFAKPQRRDRVAELLDLVGLSGFGERSVTELSGGEAQRVALARALAPRPRLLLLDEPLSSLDRSLRERLAAEMRRILTASRATAIFVTHDPDEAMTLADFLALMSDGGIVQAGPAATVWRRPVSEAAARIVGYRTFLTASWRGGVASGAWGEVAIAAEDAPPSAGSHVLALRPGALIEDPAGRLPVTAAGPPRYGAEGCLQECALADGTAVVASVSGDHAPGDRLSLAAHPARLAWLPL